MCACVWTKGGSKRRDYKIRHCSSFLTYIPWTAQARAWKDMYYDGAHSSPSSTSFIIHHQSSELSLTGVLFLHHTRRTLAGWLLNLHLDPLLAGWRVAFFFLTLQINRDERYHASEAGRFGACSTGVVVCLLDINWMER